ncbi:ATPase/histidine kinase/DNA gyrase B/HSP90 domain protein [Marvinbryantia formatexigens DSM 14469]|uniref:histidine kinase n=1 Tax=Marvinbryantia formatexigens DSM 14469 TaxID=478749 RepID=C6LKI5_9FIRM|nr:sensor histidine kinase [Marvinbryantia formatexigens]EET58884.1 ATPase/histidine kinase/DNA gyrase B/HSP90 domain protein [Marvinbryantia formatexigens DSM 14469]UWO26724.1 sensor histidine kinase [Marvinbryantia formatexigens DSM 14469]SDG87981.1 Signal transduction histidine kinase [Marvinbryantia formatexigens]
MKLTDYLLDRIFSIIAFFTAVIFSAGILWIVELRNEFIVLVEVIFCISFLLSLLWDYARKRKYYHALWTLFDKLDDKTLLAELVEKPGFLDGKLLFQILRHTNKHMNDKLAEAYAANQEYREYVEMWVHEIKTPITSAHLIIENDKNISTIRIDDELNKIDHFVEQALFYARSTALEKDFKIEKTTLKVLVHEAVKNYSKQIITAGGKPVFENLDIPVFADRKWCVFIVGQIIANSVKYTNGGLLLTFEGTAFDGGCCLSISDNGIGIAAADIPRIFDKGFTGENGRKYKKSTGIGLYLCRKLCDKMNMEISAASNLQCGTTIKITFPKDHFYFEQA